MFDSLFAILAISIKKNGRFIVPGFGTFSVKERKARKGRNPQTGETMMIKASKTVSFKPAPKYKATL
ncbi:MAG: HU family DNA-binding protein [Desulfobacterales bacterium]|nr:HU family DNA-binding protein [Desulfobacterales bacterium]